MKISSEEFRNIAIECNFDPYAMSSKLRTLYPDMELKPNKILARLERYRTKGLLPLDSGNSVSAGEVLKGSSTLYDDQGNVKLQWVRTDVPKEQFLNAFNEAIQAIAETIPALPTIQPPTVLVNEDLATLYISNDIHYGAYNWGEETESDWNLDIASSTVRAAYDHLFAHSPNSKIGIITDLGDLLEVDNDKNMTPKSGNVLDVDTRYPKILRAAYEGLIYAVNCALQKHELVYFYNITGKRLPS